MPDGSMYLGGGIGLAPLPPPLPRDPYPEPEVRAHVVEPSFLGKRAVVALVRDAHAAGWTVTVTHARGWLPNQYGRPGKLLDSLAVRMSRDLQRSVAVYQGGTTWTWGCMYVWLIGSMPGKVLTITQLRKLIL